MLQIYHTPHEYLSCGLTYLFQCDMQYGMNSEAIQGSGNNVCNLTYIELCEDSQYEVAYIRWVTTYYQYCNSTPENC
jgi:hypothetical protein